MANNLPLAVDIADAAAIKPETSDNAYAAARTLLACHPEADASLNEICAAVMAQTASTPRDAWLLE